MRALTEFRTTWRKPVIATGLFVVLLAATRLFPNGKEHSGTPAGVLLLGVVTGLIAALIAVGIVLVYRSTRIVNFAAAALGAVGAMFAASLMTILHWPYMLAFVVAVIVAAGVGVVGDMLLRRFFSAPRLVLTIATVGLMGLALQFAQGLPFLPIWGRTDVNFQQLATPQIRPVRWLKFHVAPYDFGFAHVIALIVAPVVLIGVGLFLRRTKLGVAIRASAENTERAEMLGINVKMLSTIVWALAGGLAGVAITLKATMQTFAVTGQANAEALLLPLAAAVLASMRSLPIAAAAAIGLSVLDNALGWSFQDSYASLIAVTLLVIIVTGPLLMRRLRSREREASSWQSNEETRPIPRQLAAVPEVRTWRRIVIGCALGALLIFPWITTVGPANLAGLAAIYGIVLLSITVLSGWTGQVSLGQWGLVAVGALVGGGLMNHAHFAFWLALPIGAVVTSLVAGLLGLPALRVRGLMLAVTTFAFSSVAYLVLFNEKWFGWLIPSSVNRPTLFGLDFENEKSMFYLAIVFLGLTYGLIKLFRRGRPGRVLIGMRENEDDLTAMGINAVWTRLSAFMLSGFIAGVAGVLFAVHQRAVTQLTFAPDESLNVFLWAVIGGLGSPLGAVLGAGARALQQIAPQDPILAFLFNPAFGVIVILYVAPAGLAGMVQSIRDGILRVVAQRRGIVAPTLFADAEAEAIERRLVLMTPPIEGKGLEALPAGRRYALRSEVHAVNGRNGAGAPDEREVMSAAAEALFERTAAGNGNGSPVSAGKE